MSDIVKRLNRGEGCLEEGGKTCISMDAESGCICAIAADTILALRASNAELVKSLKAALQFLDTLYPIPIDTSEKAKASIYLWDEADPSLAIANAEKTSA
jgi:hypothetical protein